MASKRTLKRKREDDEGDEELGRSRRLRPRGTNEESESIAKDHFAKNGGYDRYDLRERLGSDVRACVERIQHDVYLSHVEGRKFGANRLTLIKRDHPPGDALVGFPPVLEGDTCRPRLWTALEANRGVTMKHRTILTSNFVGIFEG